MPRLADALEQATEVVWEGIELESLAEAHKDELVEAMAQLLNIRQRLLNQKSDDAAYLALVKTIKARWCCRQCGRDYGLWVDGYESGCDEE